MANVVDPGDRYEFRIELRDKTGALSDPTTLTVTIEEPDGTIRGPFTWAAATVSRDSVGVFWHEETLDEPGLWTAEWSSTGVPTLTEFERVVVRESTLLGEPDVTLSPRALVSFEEAREYVGLDEGDVEQFDELTRAINAASASIHRVSGREFVVVGANPQTRYFELRPFRGVPTGQTEIRVGDMAAPPTAIEVSTGYGETLVAVTAEQLARVVPRPLVREEWEPIRRLGLYPAFPYGAGNLLAVTGEFGFPAVPDDVRQAVKRQVKFWLARDVEKFSETFSEQEGPATSTVPDVGRSLLRSVYDVAIGYADPAPIAAP